MAVGGLAACALHARRATLLRWIHHRATQILWFESPYLQLKHRFAVVRSEAEGSRPARASRA